jgi:hypothetical protein
MLDLNAVTLEVANAVAPVIRERFPWAKRETIVCYDTPEWTCEVRVSGNKHFWKVKLRVTQIDPPKKTYVSRNMSGSIRTLKYGGKLYGLRVRRAK